MLAENQKEFTKCNITKWHNWGYKGQGVKIAVLDEDCQSDETMADWAKFPFGEAEEGGHGIPVAKVLHEVAPQAEIHLFHYLNGNDQERAAIIDYIIRNHYDMVNVSLSVSDGKNEPVRLLESTNIPVIVASGNDGNEDKLRFPASADWTIAVGAMSEHQNEVCYYSNGGTKLDCVGFSYINYVNSKGKSVEFTGTSCAAPFITGMIACWLSWCKKIGYKPGREAVRQLIAENCLDYEAEGKDKTSGYGLFVLPGQLEPIKITMEIGRKEATVNGEKKQLEVAPYTQNDRTMVPIRFIAEALGARVDYIAAEQKIEIVL